MKIKNEILNLAIDLGKNEIEAFSFTSTGEILECVNFDSVIKKLITKPRQSSMTVPNRYNIQIDNKYYQIGDRVLNGSYCNDNTKVTEHHKLCLLLAIGLLTKTNSQFVNLLIGLPSGHISNQIEVDHLMDFLEVESNKEHHIIINGEEKRFIISELTIETEGLAMIPRLKMATSGNIHDVAVIDIGGHNFNLRKFSSQGFSLDERGVSEEQVGINKLLTEFRNDLYSELDTSNRDRNITNEDLKRYIITKKLDSDMKLSCYDGNGESFIDEFTKNYIEDNIISRLSSHGVKPNAKGMVYLFTGGGSNLLRPYIEDMFEDNLGNIVFSETAKWDNCLSFAINYLFKKNSNKNQIFFNLLQSIDSKLSNEDKNFSNLFEPIAKNLNAK